MLVRQEGVEWYPEFDAERLGHLRVLAVITQRHELLDHAADCEQVDFKAVTVIGVHFRGHIQRGPNESLSPLDRRVKNPANEKSVGICANLSYNACNEDRARPTSATRICPSNVKSTFACLMSR